MRRRIQKISRVVVRAEQRLDFAKQHGVLAVLAGPGNLVTTNDVSDLKVRVYGSTAVVTGKSNAKGSINGRELKGPVMFTRVYVKKDGKWQSVAFQQTPILAP